MGKDKAAKAEATVDEGPKYGPTDKREGEHVFAVAHIFASFNDTFVHVTDLSGRETLVRVTGGMKGKLTVTKRRHMRLCLPPKTLLSGARRLESPHCTSSYVLLAAIAQRLQDQARSLRCVLLHDQG